MCNWHNKRAGALNDCYHYEILINWLEYGCVKSTSARINCLTLQRCYTTACISSSNLIQCKDQYQKALAICAMQTTIH